VAISVLSRALRGTLYFPAGANLSPSDHGFVLYSRSQSPLTRKSFLIANETLNNPQFPALADSH